MSSSELNRLRTAIQKRWFAQPSAKAKRYIDQFFNKTRTGTKIVAQVDGNHGTYTVSVQLDQQRLSSVCSCYIGKAGLCHHCEALALTFLNDDTAFKTIRRTGLADVQTLEDVKAYLDSVTLDLLMKQLSAQGITQKAFAESIGMNPRQLSAIKSSELRNRYFNELGATKLACLWALEHIRSNKIK
jgi:uncharacterized Zn finger protein